jgi:hypothetical protein
VINGEKLSMPDTYCGTWESFAFFVNAHLDYQAGVRGYINPVVDEVVTGCVIRIFEMPAEGMGFKRKEIHSLAGHVIWVSNGKSQGLLDPPRY